MSRPKDSRVQQTKENSQMQLETQHIILFVRLRQKAFNMKQVKSQRL